MKKEKDFCTMAEISDEEYSSLEKTIFNIQNDFNAIIHNLIILRKKIGLENDWQVEQWWKNVSNFMAEHISQTISFIKNDCSSDEFYWLSEIFVDITEKQPSINFYNAAKEKLKTVENEESKRSILVELEYMKEILGIL